MSEPIRRKLKKAVVTLMGVEGKTTNRPLGRQYNVSSSLESDLQRMRMSCLFLLIASVSAALAQTSALNPHVPKIGTDAPALSFTQLIQAPKGTVTDWPSLRGKVVVLEFWATWCAPCIGEIPVLNALNASVDSSKVQIISVDDEDPAVVQAFLKKKPISGWVGIDTSSKVFEKFGVDARPVTVVVGPDGHVASTTLRPEQLSGANLLALANGGQLNAAMPTAATETQLAQTTSQAFSEQAHASDALSDALFQISLTPGESAEAGKQINTHAMMRGPGLMDITNAKPDTLLDYGAGIPATRITLDGSVPKTLYNLHVQAPNAAPEQLAHAIELAIASGAHLRIEHHTAMQDAYVLTASASAQNHLVEALSGGAFYIQKDQTLRCINATPNQIAAALEQALGAPVVDETKRDGKLMGVLHVAPKDVASANTALAAFGLTLAPAKRPIETVLITAEQPQMPHGAN